MTDDRGRRSEESPDPNGGPGLDPNSGGPVLLGQSGGGSHIYYDESDRTMFEGPAPEEREAGERTNEQPVGTRGVDGILDAINDREGWNWLSEFAEKHVPGAGDDDGSN